MRTEAVATVDDQQHDIRLKDRQTGLARHRGDDAVLDHGLKTTGVDRNKAAIAHLGLTIMPVPGQAGTVVNEGSATAGESIEERRFADVGAPDERNHRQRNDG